MNVITANRLSKSYLLKTKGERHFHAIKHVSFNIKEGETVGIIGSNGAGKSTLLKLLSGITLPTSGEGKVVGTFSSLLEVGIGFHPELNGRENVFLNASILGVSRKEAQTEMESIIAFSGVEKFIDQPLRTYSSGMKLRLAFSIIAHLKTDVILLDEVLAVGDSVFQVKCMERIFEFKKQGRTILFVSHNLSAVKKLCERTLVLQKGEIVFDGPTEEAIAFYLNSNRTEKAVEEMRFVKRIKVLTSPNPSFLEGELSLGSNTVSANQTSPLKGGVIRLRRREGVNARMLLHFHQLPSDSEVDLGINISTKDGLPLYHFSNRFIGKTLVPKDGKIELELSFNHQLKAGNYDVAVYIGQNEEQLLWQENATTLTVAPFAPYGFHNPDAIQAAIVTDFDIRVTNYE